MKTSLNSISAFTDISWILKEYSITKLAHLYSIHTAEIDDIHKYGQENKVLIWKITEAKKHPDSDHLNVVQVDLWSAWIKQIVCWATNVVDAKYVAVATVGSVLKWDFEIKLAKLRWQESNWMICSEDELDFQEDRAPWIMKLEEYFDEKILWDSIWKPFYDLEMIIPDQDGNGYKMKLSDIVFEIDNKFITNRPDLFSIEWNAREFSAIFNLPFKPYSKSYLFDKEMLGCKIESDKVLSYHLLKVENVQAAASPFWIAYSLFKSWINPKFDLVDMTNYIMTELGQPMHAFDADKIDWNITVRFAKKWEKMLALNGETYELDSADIVIADDKKVLAIWWIIGWQESAISETTKNIYIESACFHPTSIRLTSLRLWVRTDSSTRYEKSLDPLLSYKALSRSLDFLKFVWKEYKVIWNFEYLNKDSVNDIDIDFTSDFICKKIWINIPESEIIRIMNQLWFEISKAWEIFTVKVPSFRATKDISIKEDIAEEIWRIYSYDKVPEIPLKWEFTISKGNKDIVLKRTIKDYYTSKWYFEVYNYSFSNESLDEKIWIKSHEDAIKIINAYSNEFTIYRRAMIANILQNVADNKGTANEFGFFEIWKVWRKTENGFTEEQKIAWVKYTSDFNAFRSELDWLCNSISHSSKLSIVGKTSLDKYPFLHPNKSWEVFIWNELVWFFGYVNPATAKAFELDDSKLLYFEFDFTRLFEIESKTSTLFNEISKFPWIDRELNFVMDEKVFIWDIIEDIKKIHELIKEVRVIDIYRNSEKIWEGKKSVSFSVFIQDKEKTITDADALAVQNKIIDVLSSKWIIIRK